MNDETIQSLRNHALADQAKTLPRTDAAFASWSPSSLREDFERMERDLAAAEQRLDQATHFWKTAEKERDDALYREQMLRSSERNLLEVEAFKDAQLVAAQNEVAALRLDRERLDWLGRRNYGHPVSLGPKDLPAAITNCPSPHLREAIDAAMKESTP